MYTNWLSTCTEKQLFVFIETSLTEVIRYESHSPLWATQQEESIIEAMEQTTRFGVPRTEREFNAWYARMSVLSSAKKEMPWRTN